MEDIEYLEEYEDLVLPALNSAAAEAAAASSASFETIANQLNQKNNDEADDSSSSLDQDIFNCLFDDNSDDEDYNNDQNKESESALRQKTTSHDTFVTLEDKFQKIGNTVIEKVEISRQDPQRKQNITPKPANKITSTTKPKSYMTKTSGTTVVPLSPIKQQTSVNKTKSVATVRPTVNSHLNTSSPKNANILQKAASSSVSSSSSAAAPSAIKQRNSSTSATYRTIRFPVVPPKLSLSTASSPLPANRIFSKSSVVSSVTTARSSTVPKKYNKRPATIIRPEKIISKDPANDPLDLDDISEAESHNSSFSDISGETYNTISDLDEDDSNAEYYSGEDDFYEDEDEVNDISSTSQIIELSNDSSNAPSKLEDIRAPTPTPVISDDSDTSGSSSGFIISKKQTIKPYSHPAIIESVLRKGEKPKLLALLQTFNLLEDSVENIKEDKICIDITTSTENLVENTNTQEQQQQQVTSSKQTLPSVNIVIDPVDSTVSNKSLTLNTPKIEQTLSKSKKSNKKRKKKSLTNMDATNDYSTDSDLSAVEELLEESYAEAMKRVSNVPVANPDIGADIVLSEEERNTRIVENEQKLPKTDVVIDYDDKSKEIKQNKTECTAESLKEQNNIATKDENQLNKESKKLESTTRNQTTTNEILETNLVDKTADNNNAAETQANSVECQDIVEIVEVSSASKTDCQSNRKKKRFRNLITPEPTEKSSDEAKSMDDLTDFKGFDEEVKPSERLETKELPQPGKDIVKSSENHLPTESFKSPFKSHQSLKEKSKEAKSKSSSDKSSDSREKSKHKTSSDISKDRRSSRESSKETSKDRTRHRSKDRSRHNSRDKDHRSKHHHRDPSSSCDSKDSSKSRESSKSRDSKEIKDSSKSNSAKKSHSLHSNRDKSHEAKNEKCKDYDHRKDSKDHKKSSTEKCDKKSSEATQKTIHNETAADKPSGTDIQESKPNKDVNKFSSASIASTSRDATKDHKTTNKNQDSAKSGHESKKSEKSKATTDQNKSIKTKTSPTTTTSEKVPNSIEQQKPVSKTSSQNVHKDKIIKTSNNETAEEKVLQNPEISSNTPSNTSKAEFQIATSNENKASHQSDSSHKTQKIRTSKKHSDESSKHSSSSEMKDATKLSCENVQKLKALVQPDEVKSTNLDCKQPKEIVKNTKLLDTKKMSNSPKRSHNAKLEELKNADEKIKNTEAIKYKQLEVSKDEKSANQKSKEKPIEHKHPDNQTKDSLTVSEKSNITNSSDKQQQIVLEKDKPKKSSKKEDSTDKSNINNQAHNSKSDTSVKQQTTDKPLAKVQKKNAGKTPEKKQKLYGQEPVTVTPKNVTTKAKNPGESSSTNKEKLKGNKTTEKMLDSKATLSSPKTLKKPPQSTFANTKTEPIKTLAKSENTSRESKSIINAHIAGDKKETKRHDDYLKTKSNEDVKSKVKEKPIENMIEETKPSNLNDVPATKTENQDENTVSKKRDKDDGSPTPSSKTKRLMETVLKKSVVILIEPLQPIHQQYLVKRNGGVIEIEPIITRSRNENLKQNDTKEDHSKEKSFKKIDNIKPKRVNESQVPSVDTIIKSEKIASDEQMTQMVVVKEDINNSEANIQATIKEKSKNEEPIKNRQKSDKKQPEIKFSDNKETTEEEPKNGEPIKTRQKSDKNQTDIKLSDNKEAVEEKSKNKESIKTRQKSDKSQTEIQFSDNNEIAEEKPKDTEDSNQVRQKSDKNQPEMNFPVNEETTEETSKNEEPVKTGQKSDKIQTEIKFSDNKETAEEKSENKESIKTRQKTDKNQMDIKFSDNKEIAEEKTKDKEDPNQVQQKSDKNQPEMNFLVNEETTEETSRNEEPVKIGQQSDKIQAEINFPDSKETAKVKSKNKESIKPRGASDNNQTDIKISDNKETAEEKTKDNEDPNQVRQKSDKNQQEMNFPANEETTEETSKNEEPVKTGQQSDKIQTEINFPDSKETAKVKSKNEESIKTRGASDKNQTDIKISDHKETAEEKTKDKEDPNQVHQKSDKNQQEMNFPANEETTEEKSKNEEPVKTGQKSDKIQTEIKFSDNKETAEEKTKDKEDPNQVRQKSDKNQQEMNFPANEETTEEKSKNEEPVQTGQKSDQIQTEIDFPDSKETAKVKSKNEESIKTRGASDKNQTDIKFSDNKETTDEKTSVKEKVVLKTNSQNLENQAKTAPSVKSEATPKPDQGKHSETIEIKNASNKSEIENNKNVFEEETISQITNNFEPITTRQKVKIKTTANRSESVGKEKCVSEIESESHETSVCEERSSERIQTRKKTDLPSEPPSTYKALAKEKSDIKTKGAGEESSAERTICAQNVLIAEGKQCQKVERKESCFSATKSPQKRVVKVAIKGKETMDTKSEKVKHNFEQKSADLETDSNKSEKDGFYNDKTETKKENFEPIKTRQKTDLKSEQNNSKADNSASMAKKGASDKKTFAEETEGLNSETITTRQKTGLTTQTKNSEIAVSDKKVVLEEKDPELFKTIQKTDLEKETKASEICDKTSQQEKTDSITGITRQTPDLEAETKKSEAHHTKEELSEMSEYAQNSPKPKKSEEAQNSTTDDSCKVHITTEEEKSVDRQETKNKKEEEEAEQNECDIYSVQSMKEIKPEEPVKESLKTRLRGNLKEEKSDNEKADTKLTEESNLDQNVLEPIRKRRRDDRTKARLSRSKISDDEQNETLKEHVGMTKTRRWSKLKEGGDKERKEEIGQEKSGQKVTTDVTSELIKTTPSKDSTVEAAKENNQSEKPATKTRRSRNSKEVIKEMTERSEHEARRSSRGDSKAENKKELNVEKTSGCFAADCNEVTEEKNTIGEDAERQHLKSRITRSRTELGVESAADDKNMIEKNVEPISTKRETKHMSKEDVQTQGKLIESVKTRKGRNEDKTSQNDTIASTADKNQTETLSSQEPTNQAKQQEGIAEESVSLKIISEIDKIIQETSEKELPGFESPSPSTDYGIRRTLRKRGTDSSPFPENETIKKPLREPFQKTTVHLTSKSTKTENAVSNVSNVGSKRNLRSPAQDIDIKSPSKKPKLDPTKKSTRSHNPTGIDPKEGLTIASTKANVMPKEQPQAIEKIKLNESVTIIRKTTQNELNKGVKDTSKNITLIEKKVEEKVKGRNPTRNSSVNMLPEETLDNESTLQSTNKDASSKIRADVGNEAQLPPVQSKNGKTKPKTTPSKTSGSATSSGSTTVLSFSEWLKTKNQTTTSSESVATNEDIPDTSKRQSRTRTRITPNKSKQDIEKLSEVSQAPLPEDRTMILVQSNEKVSASQGNISAVRVQPKASIANENMDVAQQSGNSSLRSFEHRAPMGSKEQKQFPKSNKVIVKRLRTSISDPKKSSPSRSKKNEIALLIESMSKEMKDGGITNLLNTETHVKRQRVPNTKNLDVSALPATTLTKETRTLATAVVHLPNMQCPNEQPNIMNVTQNFEYKNKSPTRRRAQQNSEKSRRSTPVLHTDSSSRDSINISDTTAPTKQAVAPEDPKIRKSLNIKDLPRHTEIATKTSTALDVGKTRKSMPLMASEDSSLAKNARKTFINSKKPQVSEVKIFKLPRPTGASIVLNKATMPNVENVNRSNADDKKLADSRTKVHPTDQFLLKKFKCRKLAVRLDRTVVQHFLNSTSNRTQTTITREKRARRPTDALKIMQNNSETNLRIRSVVDAATLFNASSSSSEMREAQAAPTQLSSSTTNLQNSSVTPVSISAQPSYILPNSTSSVTSLAVPLLNESFELKNEFMDENPVGSINEAILPDTPTLLARAQTVTEAAQQALSNSATPTDIRLLSADSTESHFVPSFGMRPTALDSRGTCMYTFLHPAKYNRNHSNVLLDYCCPNLDGPMPAIDPTRIHAQVQVPVIELPASIVLTTKVVTREDLENDDTAIPAIIRKKAEKIRKNLATHHKMAVSTVNTMTPSTGATSSTPRSTLPPTINALTKQLPPTTIITQRGRPTQSQQTQMMANQLTLLPPSSVAQTTVPKNAVISVIPKANMAQQQLSSGQQSNLRSNLRRFDVLLKQLTQPYESLSFVERHRVIEAIISSGKCLPKDLEPTLVLMEEYIKQTMLLRSEKAPPTPAIIETNDYTEPQPAVVNILPATQMPQLQPSPKILASKAAPALATSYSNQFEQTLNKPVRKVQTRGRNVTSETSDPVANKTRQVPIYDTDRNIIGYQMQVVTPISTIPTYTKPSMPSQTGAIVSTPPDTAYKATKRPLKRPAQDSPRVFYTTPPLKTSTPKVVTNSTNYPAQQAKIANTVARKSQGSIVTTVRAASSSTSADSGTITTTTMATVKRVTRSTVTGSKIIIVSKSNQSSEETILPDTDTNPGPTEQTEIKHEKDIEEFLG